nr:MAG TPA: hypothetical protein [Caudoviricetes sp.]
MIPKSPNCNREDYGKKFILFRLFERKVPSE